jgi:hypothetical protein
MNDEVIAVFNDEVIAVFIERSCGSNAGRSCGSSELSVVRSIWNDTICSYELRLCKIRRAMRTFNSHRTLVPLS